MLKVDILILHVDGDARVAVRSVSALACSYRLVMALRADVSEDSVVDRDVGENEWIGRHCREVSADVSGIAAEGLEQVEPN